jgi:uncharacterized protein YicC (UPF0701 family)
MDRVIDEGILSPEELSPLEAEVRNMINTYIENNKFRGSVSDEIDKFLATYCHLPKYITKEVITATH